ncbi:uncharacterized protein LOC143026345 [Oratosquilla oratoria]|uniref:uncharacterized protein LOC143026345 n=1 Tax=Oratosquilla oratoria TaxID=337810 RepID=UPI003F76B1A7
MWPRWKIHFLTLTGLSSLAWCLNTPEVYLRRDGGKQEETYLPLRVYGDDTSNYVLGCSFDLDDGEKVFSITWHHNRLNDVIFVWKPTMMPNVYENYYENVNMDRKDGNIEFLNVLVEFEGIYFCQISTNKMSSISPSYELVIADMGSHHYRQSNIKVPGKQCRELYSFSTPAIYPPPRVDSGVWDGNQWVQKLVPVPHLFSNGSMQYAVTEFEFETDQFPENFKYRLEVGIEKKNGEYISLYVQEDSIPPCTITEETVNSDTDENEGSGNGDLSIDGGEGDGNDGSEVGSEVGSETEIDVNSGGSGDGANGDDGDVVHVSDIHSGAALHSISTLVFSIAALYYLGNRD